MDSESQQRKRKAPVPPSTAASITPDADVTSTSVASTPDSHYSKTATPASCTKVTQSTTISASAVVMEKLKPVPLKTAVEPPPACAPTPTNSYSSSSTTDSLAVQDSSSEFSHSLDESDSELDQTSSQCSSLTSNTACGSVLVQSTGMAAQLNQEMTGTSSSRLETQSESDFNLKLDEAENRHSAVGKYV